MLREILGGMPDDVRVPLLEDLVERVRVEEGDIHESLGRAT